MKFTTLLILLSIYIYCDAQIINNNPIEVGIGEKQFNPDIIRNNNIKSIIITIINKPDGMLIKDIGKRRGYIFNKKGYVEQYYYTVNKKANQIAYNNKQSDRSFYKTDTVFEFVMYDSLNRIIISSSLNNYYKYKYNNLNQVIKKSYFKGFPDINNQGDAINNIELFSSKKYSYKILTNKQTKKEVYYDDGYAYKKAIIHYDEKKNIVAENVEFISSWILEDYTYKYDNNNNIIEHTYKSNRKGEVQLKETYFYDEFGKLVSNKKFINDQLVIERNYLYDNENKLIKSEVNRDHANNSVIIVKYKYSYY